MLDVSTPAVAANGKPAAEPDPRETDEWIEALDGVISAEGPQRAREIIEALTVRARTRGADIPITLTTPYVNTIPVHAQPAYPGNHDIEEKLRHYSRWNAMAMVVRANKYFDGLGGHVATFQSSATLMDVGFNHFWHPPSANHGGDLVYFQGHASPGARTSTT
jgi:pyruvate dehydrogenase E1 component